MNKRLVILAALIVGGILVVKAIKKDEPAAWISGTVVPFGGSNWPQNI